MRDWASSRSGMSILLPLLLLYNGRPFGAVPLHTKRWRASGGDGALNRETHGTRVLRLAGAGIFPLLGGLWLRVGAQLSASVPCPRELFLPELWLARAGGALQSSQSNLFSGFSVCKTRQPLVHYHPLGSGRGESHPEPCASCGWGARRLRSLIRPAWLFAFQTRSSPCPSW